MARTYVDLTEQVSWPSWASGAVLLGAGAAQPTVVSPGASGNLLTSNGSAWASAAPANQRNELTSRSASTSLTLTTAVTTWVYTGTSGAATWTLPAVSGNTGCRLTIENASGYSITLVRAGSDFLWFRSASATNISIAPGASLVLVNDGSYWQTLSLDILNNAASLTGLTLVQPTILGYTETYCNIGTVSSAATINLANGTVQSLTLTASTGCAITLPSAAYAGQQFVLYVRQPASTGGGSASFSGSVVWIGGTAPTITTSAGAWDILTFISDGTVWSGSYVQGF